MDPEEICRCDHERKWHDACSKCSCPWFIAKSNTAALKRWRRDRKARERAEAN